MTRTNAVNQLINIQLILAVYYYYCETCRLIFTVTYHNMMTITLHCFDLFVQELMMSDSNMKVTKTVPGQKMILDLIACRTAAALIVDNNNIFI